MIRRAAAVLAAVAIATCALAAPEKPVTSYQVPPRDPATIRQGGDTIADAVAITLPYTGSGTTIGYTNDYDGPCPYYGSTSPDVVYSLTPATDVSIDVDLCGSSYDTKVYVFDSELTIIACNDDFYYGDPCGQYVSKLESVSLTGGETYYIVVDGYGGDAGAYEIVVDESVPCVLNIPADAVDEGEPPLHDGYVDDYNGGCQYPPDYAFQHLVGDPQGNLVFHGRSGWYHGASGAQYRDNDYFTAIRGPAGDIEVTADAVVQTYVFEFSVGCDDLYTLQVIPVGPCTTATMNATGAPEGEVWLFVLSSTFEPPSWLDPDGDGVAEYDYVLWISGLASGPVVTETETWGHVKTLFR